jgi:uncharacterized protein
MIIIGLADVHGSLPPLNHLTHILKQADVVLLVGDLTNFGRETEAESVVLPIVERSGTVFAVPGNCDYSGVDAYLNKQKINLHGRGKVINGIGFVGLGGSLVTPFGTPNEYTEEEISFTLKKALSDIPDKTPLILVSHQPPVQTSCDKISSGAHVGSYSVRKFIEIHQPVVCFTGHIHESTGIDIIEKTQIINPGQLGRGGYSYAEIKDGDVFVEIRRWH